jgi:uncharacterized protein YtpQ (UPF0354 family)
LKVTDLTTMHRRKVTLALLGVLCSGGGLRARAQHPGREPMAPPAGSKADIVPLVRSFTGAIRKAQEIRPLPGVTVQGEADLAPLIDTFVGDMDIRYAFDAPSGFRYLNERDLKTLGLARDRLLAQALSNFRRRYPGITVERPVAFVGKLANGGELEPSMMLDADFWEKEKARPLHGGGDIVAAVPTRDILWFTGSRSAQNVRNLRANTERSHQEAGVRAISKLMYVWRNKRWEVLDT